MTKSERRARLLRAQGATIGDRPGNARALEGLRRVALDMQAKPYWIKVWAGR